MERARREGYLERGRARDKGYPSPIWDSIQDTHSNYDRIVTEGLEVPGHLNDIYWCTVEDFLEASVHSKVDELLAPGTYGSALVGCRKSLL